MCKFPPSLRMLKQSCIFICIQLFNYTHRTLADKLNMVEYINATLNKLDFEGQQSRLRIPYGHSNRMEVKEPHHEFCFGAVYIHHTGLAGDKFDCIVAATPSIRFCPPSERDIAWPRLYSTFGNFALLFQPHLEVIKVVFALLEAFILCTPYCVQI